MIKKLIKFRKSVSWIAGFTLMETLVGGGLLAGASLAAVKIFSEQRAAQKRIELDRILDAHLGTIRSSLSVKTSCDLTIGGGSAVSAFPSTLTMLKITASAATDNKLIAVNEYINPQQTHMLNSISLANPGTSNLVKMTLSYTTRMFNNTVVRSIYIPVKFSLPGGSSTYECLDDKMGVDKTLQKEGCEAISTLGDYNYELQDCTLSNTKLDSSGTFNCPAGEIVTGLAPSGVPVCQVMDTRLFPADGSGTPTTGCAGKQARIGINSNNQLVIECF